MIAEDKTSLGLAFSKEQINVACPWHGYEFDVQTGQHQGNPRLRLRPVKIEIVDAVVVVIVPEGARERIARARSKRAEPHPP
jgi:nitrite reductase (NADH) small subunit